MEDTNKKYLFILNIEGEVRPYTYGKNKTDYFIQLKFNNEVFNTRTMKEQDVIKLWEELVRHTEDDIHG